MLPGAARAQQTQMPVIGFLGSETPALWTDRVAAFRQGLSSCQATSGFDPAAA